jgi:allantoate deiminase
LNSADLDALTDQVLARCDALGAISDDPACLTRTFLSPATKIAHELLAGWMRDAGLDVRRDAIGNLIGRKPGRSDRVFAIGSHIDTVPNAGKYDGVLGVLIGLAAMKAAKERHFALTVDVLAFSEEEGVRFRTPYLGSRTVCGQFDSRLPELKDDNEVTLLQVVRDFGLDPDGVRSAAYRPDQLVAYFEVHIEQGPILESLDRPLGVVSAIIGQSRHTLRFIGQSGHAGTVPMELRRDALAAAAEFIGMVEQSANAIPGTRATVGRLAVTPGATNVIPGQVSLSLDVRNESNSERNDFESQILTQAQSIADKRGVALEAVRHLATPSTFCDVILSKQLDDAIESCGISPHWLVSGAGHDAVVMASRCPVAMLFIRSPGGISHHPDESVHRGDVRAALDATIRFLSVELNRE